jgi:hypothetical protein
LRGRSFIAVFAEPKLVGDLEEGAKERRAVVLDEIDEAGVLDETAKASLHEPSFLGHDWTESRFGRRRERLRSVAMCTPPTARKIELALPAEMTVELVRNWARRSRTGMASPWIGPSDGADGRTGALRSSR